MEKYSNSNIYQENTSSDKAKYQKFFFQTNRKKLSVDHKLLSNSKVELHLSNQIDCTNSKGSEIDFLNHIMHPNRFTLRRVFGLNFLFFIFVLAAFMFFTFPNLVLDIEDHDNIAVWSYTKNIGNILKLHINYLYKSSYSYGSIIAGYHLLNSTNVSYKSKLKIYRIISLLLCNQAF